MNRLDELINKTNNVHNKEQNTDVGIDKTIAKIKKKFNKLELYEFKLPTAINLNEMIRYVDKDLKKMSIIGIVVKIDHFSAINDKSDIKTIHLYSPFTETSWSINPSKYYLFKVRRASKEREMVNQLMKDYIDQIDKYLKKQ